MMRILSMKISALLSFILITFVTSCASESNDIAGLECRSLEVSGSRMRERFCATPEQWAEYTTQGEDATEFKRRMESLSGTINTSPSR